MILRKPFWSFLLLVIVLGIASGILFNKDIREFIQPPRDFLLEMEKMRENMRTFQDVTLDAMKRAKDKPQLTDP